MAGYSSTPLAKKLGIKKGHSLVFRKAPADFAQTLEPLPEDVRIKVQLRGPLNVILFFTRRENELLREFPRLKRSLALSGGLWIAWPKKASGVPTDLSFDVVQRMGLGHGLVDNKVCAIDETWSALRFVFRLKDRRP
ncbi:MAG: DUF3052 domain-containing protein [Deltaproteobacteria bacterium]|nr:DUF3052 domain-containing protein [Deltaproteobacteria bacterium]